MCELSIIGARASVMVYDDTQKKWVPSGSSSGLSKVQIYHHQQNNTFRVVGRKLQDHEVVINCSIVKGLKYNQATATFHQWRDSKIVYGLNFSSQQDAADFARAMTHALDILCGRIIPPSIPPPPNGLAYDEDMGYRTMTREDAAIIQQQQITGSNTSPATAVQTPTSQCNQNIPASPPSSQGHHRTSSAPPAPQPPPMSMPPQIFGTQQQSGTLPSQHHQQQYQQTQQQPIQQQTQPQQQQQQQQPPIQQLQQRQQAQQTQLYTTQLSQESFGSNQNMSQYSNQPIYVSSTTNQHLQQQPHPPPHSQNGPIYVASNQSTGIPSSASNNSVYSSHQQQQPQQPPQPQQPQQQQQSQPITIVAPPSSTPINYGQTNGISNVPTPQQYAQQQIPIPPQMPTLINNNNNNNNNNINMNVSGGPPQAPPPPPSFNNNAFINGPQPPPMAPPCPPPMFGAMAALNASPSSTTITPTVAAPTSSSGTTNSVCPPPPPPPPMMGLNMKSEGMDMSTLAAQLQQAKLKRNAKNTPPPPPPAENSGSSTSSGGSGNYGTIGRTSTGMASMMDEMAKTLARRRAQAEKKPEPEQNDDMQSTKRPWEKSNTLPHKLGGGGSNTQTSNNNSNGVNNNCNSNNINGGSGGGGGGGPDSPRPSRKRFGSASEETILKQVNGDTLSLANPQELENFKAEIIREIRIEINKAKQEILDAIKIELNRR